MQSLNDAFNFDDMGTVVCEDDTQVITHYTADDIAQIVNSPSLVSTRAIIARINRKLTRDDRQLHVCRPDAVDFHRIGRYYVMDRILNALIEPDVDLRVMARELDVLRDGERITDD